ncbi:nucleoside hydrolase [Scleromatobacter humisilvae]|uniref:Nucleoside hydrolase n=1 Tax=Scleromatobacter humisilvae TaxID=2897159 RepID=A0A9X1YJX2_9BURK|nr:nucleoside hydrolase [Scleromatobacter humisilvae]MCK9686245.1 nucleoside hydrolase [Scleromatobacter humisilvae]
MIRCLAAALAALLLATGSAPSSAADGHRLVIVDQDMFGPGGSNMNSVLMLLQAPDVDVLGIVVSSGDGWREEEIAQTLRMLELVGRPEVPVYAGAEFPLLNSAARMKAWERRYGPLVWKGAWTDSFGGQPRAEYHADPFLVPPLAAGPPSLKAQAESGVDFMIRTVHAHPGRVTLWMGGALTDLALASRLDPGLAAATRELVFMGGSFNPVAADNSFADEYAHSPRREFNMLWDAEAASAVLHEAWPRVVQIPVDPTTRTFFSKALYAEIGQAKTPVASYVARFGEGFPMWDELAAAVWLDPSLVKRSQKMLEDVAAGDGADYGSTLSWPLGRGPGLGEREVEVVQDVDVPRFERLTVKLLSAGRAPAR